MEQVSKESDVATTNPLSLGACDSPPNLNALEQLVDFLVAEFLAQ